MYDIISKDVSEYLNLNPYLINHMDIMSSYNKAALVVDIVNKSVYLNDIAMNIFKIDSNQNVNYLCLNIAKDLYNTELLEKKIIIKDLNLELIYNLKIIKEKNFERFIICNIEEWKDLSIDKKNSSTDDSLKAIIGESKSIRELKKNIEKVSINSSTVLIVGESGTGKELIARGIHNLSDRKNRPFVVINCGAIPESLIESELFGYDKGSFTGANQKGKIGLFEKANRGTIFLDEIENMSDSLQMKILRVIEDKKITRVGALEEVDLDFRIIAATNIDLKDLVNQGLFRKDLFYRLNIVKLKVPNLNERENDIELLTDYFIKMFSNIMKTSIIGISTEVKDMFLKHNWDGNVRELKNTIEYAINFEEGQYITINSLPEEFSDSPQKLEKHESNIDFRPIAEIEKEEIIRALNYFGWDDKGKQKAAKVLDISRSSIYRKVLKLDEKNEVNEIN